MSQNIVMRWVDVRDALPLAPRDGSGHVYCGQYIVNVVRSHYPSSPYDYDESPYDEEFVAVATYDFQQKIWIIGDCQYMNALLDIENSPLDGDYITHWMPMPKSPEG